MDLEVALYLLIILITGSASVLAWVAKIRWASQYKEATERTLQAKDSEIEALKTRATNFEVLNSEVLLARAKQTKLGLEAVIEENEEELGQARAQIEDLQLELKQVKEAELEDQSSDRTPRAVTLHYDELIEKITNDIATAESNRSELEQREMELRVLKLESAPETVQRFRENVHSLQGELSEIQKSIADATEAWNQVKDGSTAEFNRTRGEVIALKSLIEAVEQDGPALTCPLCIQPVDEVKDDIIERLRAKWDELVARAVEYKRQIADATAKPAELVRLEDQYNSIAARLTRESERLARAEMAEVELVHAKERLRALQEET